MTGQRGNVDAFTKHTLPAPEGRNVCSALVRRSLACFESGGQIQIIDTGVDAINPIEPVAGMDIGDVKQKYGDRVCLVGNVDCSHILSEASTDEVTQSVAECIRKGSPGGGHIIASSNCIHSAVKPENYLAMIQATKQFGGYPIA